MNLEEKVLKIVSNVMEIPVGQLDVQSSSDTVENWDSLRQMNLTLALEEEFKVFFTDEEIINMQNVEKIIKTLNVKHVPK
jgi:acyl carrier protein